MSTINQVEKTDYSAVKIDYTSKDYTNILNDLINSIPGITDKWETTDENDVGMVLVKLMSILGDMLFYEQDLNSLEVYPNSVTLRKNASVIYKLIGYKMKWYRSATLQADVVNTYANDAILPRFCNFTTKDGSINYTTFRQYNLASNTNNNGNVTEVELVEGLPVTPTRISSNPIPETGKPWHSVYGFNYTTDDIINNRIYLKDLNIDQSHVILVDDQNEEWELKDNVYLTRDVGKFFEFNVDTNDQPYLELIDYWKNYPISKFKIFYIRSSGEDGQIFANVLTRVSGSVWSNVQSPTEDTVHNVNNFIKFTHFASTLGYGPETPDEARKESVKFQNTLDTLITLADYERAVLRMDGVANVRATDVTNDPGIDVENKIGDINLDGYVTEEDLELLGNYLDNPTKYPLNSLQIKLADVDQDGQAISRQDYDVLYEYFYTDYDNISEAEANRIKQEVIHIGNDTITQRELLEGFTVKLYILRTPEYEDMDEEYEESYITMIKGNLQDYKVLPIKVIVDLHSILKCYWTVKGRFFTKEPLSRDELQTIIVNITNNLRFKYGPTKVNFNTLINYREVIDVILATDSRIMMVDLEPIEYTDEENNPIDKSELTGIKTLEVPPINDANPELGYDYEFYLPDTPILPGSVMIKLNNGGVTLRDDNNGVINNSNSALSKNGKVDYQTGKVTLNLMELQTVPIQVEYTKNRASVATYKNLNTQDFYFDSSSLEQTINENLV